jgi:tungstate transport system substrate-binding protein
MYRASFVVALVLAFALTACGDDDNGNNPDHIGGELILATTTSTQDSGLLDVLAPMFSDETGVNVKTIAVGSGQAIQMGSRGDADVVFAHSPAAEIEMVEAGDGIERAPVMYNDFVIVGPSDDPARAADATSTDDALTAIAADGHFISRGDDSGTHALELRLWDGLGIDPAGEDWYEESGQGMGATLQIANQREAYTLTDRGTYLSQEHLLNLEIVFEGDQGLHNVYHVIVVNPERHGAVNAEAARAFAAFLVRGDVQEIIGDFGTDEHGQPLFFPDAGSEQAYRRITEVAPMT